jgi:transposase
MTARTAGLLAIQQNSFVSKGLSGRGPVQEGVWLSIGPTHNASHRATEVAARDDRQGDRHTSVGGGHVDACPPGGPPQAELLALLRRWARSPGAPHRVVTRSRIALLAAEGHPPAAVARMLGVSRATVRLWRERFLLGGPSALWRDAPGRGRRPGLTARVTHAVRMATESESGGGRASARAVARRAGVSPTSVRRVWRELGMAPDTVQPGES